MMSMRVLALMLIVVHVAEAQTSRRPARRDRIMAGSVDPVSVRAEYASLLLQTRRYRDAATEFRRLLLHDPGNFEWRLNYARALAWGDAHRAAEVELKRLQARAPRNTSVESLLRSVRASIEPTSREARAWVAERPSYVPYRLSLARAYVRERRPRAAFSHFDMVVARDPTAALFAEAGDAHAAAGDRRGAANMYRRAVERSLSDPALRRTYARALTADRQYGLAIEQYSILIDERADPRLLVERGDARRRAGDEAGAERDLLASIALYPTPDAYTALGDMYRSRGQLERARATYRQAVQLHPNDRRATLRLWRLTRDARPGFGFSSTLAEQRGVTVGSRAFTDNTGFVYAAGEIRRGFALGPGTVAGVGVEPRVVYDRSPGGVLLENGSSAQRIVGVAATAGLAHEYFGEEIDARIAGRGGVVGHTSGESVPQFAGGAVVTYRGAWSLSIEGTGGPAYENVMALAVADDPSLVSGDATSALLTSRTFAVAATVPFGIADVGAVYEAMWLSDGNRQSAFQAAVRVPLTAKLSLLYTAGAIGFAERSTLYWDPQQYVTHSLGFETGVRTDQGLAFTARVLPGLARAVDGLTSGEPSNVDTAIPGVAHFVTQVNASADLSIRRNRWETVLGAAYGTGRAGGYQRFDGSLRVRYTP